MENTIPSQLIPNRELAEQMAYAEKPYRKAAALAESNDLYEVVAGILETGERMARTAAIKYLAELSTLVCRRDYQPQMFNNLPDRYVEIDITDDDGKDVITTLKDLRNKSGMTQIQVAEAMGITQPAIAKLESNTHHPRLDTVVRYAQAVGAQQSVKSLGTSS